MRGVLSSISVVEIARFLKGEMLESHCQKVFSWFGCGET
jgi:hypothetical protein